MALSANLRANIRFYEAVPYEVHSQCTQGWKDDQGEELPQWVLYKKQECKNNKRINSVILRGLVTHLPFNNLLLMLSVEELMRTWTRAGDRRKAGE